MRESSGDIGAGALIGKDPEIEFGQKAKEVVEGLVRLGEALDPEV